ncbi:hypothetical protein [Mycobacterium conspicuum]|jgi:hypothetical protein|uniref:Uncharacterized protein n=1 Tax=Mycobacterium conspicuum TaxID=44010 RepID=A0A1X1SWJ1_9MYCO|nr:hypothetical protein [Mycobacterium conspicuum]ORV35295.1 hypothetical protein AWC00_24990 [Mycobacterium conspicuum]BBZ37403.1 hypothetical protein MCNS_04660 [Mycobacterium conspicuum]
MHTEAEITAWLEPLFAAAESTDIDLWAIVEQATLSVDEGSALRCSEAKTEHGSDVKARMGDWPDLPDAEVRLVVDWVRFGQILCHELGWDDSYPRHPAVALDQLRRNRELIGRQIRERFGDSH